MLFGRYRENGFIYWLVVFPWARAYELDFCFAGIDRFEYVNNSSAGSCNIAGCRARLI